ncbi:hypothetical protein MNBD_DELTA01-1168 [hydrothermal vent metagenome]|uniref:Endonuclease n=1 Tax=hydrothermal vent metagenome TaxID=652676 RepID=A0A3B0R8Y2_9ZZZZ
MKHNTHIYLAAKAIEFMREGLGNIRHAKSKKEPKNKRNISAQGKTLQRMLMHYEEVISEASWAPDDILNDKAQFHTFKLFTERDFPGASAFAKETHKNKDNENYYRIKGGGGLPYKIDHLARVIADMDKLRRYNDRCSMQQIMYQYLMISHYIVDAHVPMHCDIRDDKPSKKDKTKPKNGKYYSGSLHGKIEGLWDKAVTPVAIREEILKPTNKKESAKATELSEAVTFDLKNKDHLAEIKPLLISDKDVLGYMINTCIRTKDRSLDLFPVASPDNWNEAGFPAMTREIFAETIGTLISVWIWIWLKSHPIDKKK